MSRTKGMPKTGGRQAGTPNKVTATLKEFVSELIDRNRPQIESDLEKLEPKERLMILERLMGYVIPKQTHNDVQMFDWSKEQLEIVYVKSGHEPCHDESEIDLERDPRYYKP